MLEIKGINKSFNKGTVDEKNLFSDFSLEVDDREFVAVVGSNGSGKTTLLNIISGSLFPESGSVVLDGEDLTGMSAHKRARHIARVFQNPSVGTCSRMTIFENMSLADNKAKSFNLTQGLNKKRLDFYRQSLEILGMGLENRMDTLLLDEHTAALDPRSADVVMQLTDRIISEKKLTALMVTHNLRYAVEYGTRSIMMHEGNVVLDFSGEEKKKKTIDDYLKQFNEISIECGN